MAREISVMMCGPSLRSKGGIAAAASTLLMQEPLGRMGVGYIATWTDGPMYERVVTFLGSVLRLAKWAKPGRVVHLHMASRGSFLRKATIQTLVRAKGARTIIHLHGAQFHTFAESAPDFLKRAIRRAFRRADVVIVLSESWRERVAAFSGRTDAVVVPNPVDIPRTSAAFKDPRRVVFVGRLGRRKGVYDLLDAIRTLQESGRDDVRWVLAGDGDVSQCRRVARTLPYPDRVEIPGWVSGSDVEELLRESWVFCLPSYDEGLPVALLQAMAAGLACVVTPVGGIPEYVEDRVNGVMVPVGDARSLAAALDELLCSEAACVKLGQAARASVESRCSASIVAANIVGIYNNLLGDAGERP